MNPDRNGLKGYNTVEGVSDTIRFGLDAPHYLRNF